MCSRKVSAIHPGMIFGNQTAATCFGLCPKAAQSCIHYGYSFLQRCSAKFCKPSELPTLSCWLRQCNFRANKPTKMSNLVSSYLAATSRLYLNRNCLKQVHCYSFRCNNITARSAPMFHLFASHQLPGEGL